MNTKRIRRDRRQRSCPTTTISFSPYLWRAAATVFVWSLLLSTSLLAAAAAPRRPARGNKNSVLSSDASTIRLSRSKIYLWRQRLIRDRLQRQFEAETAASIAATASGKTNRRGSTLTIGLPPTPERLTAWFGSCSSCSSNECDTGTTQASFNHESVGMTNPCLHVMLRQEEEGAVVAAPTVDATKLVSVTKKTKRRTPKAIESSSTGGDGWWPGTIPDRYLSKTWRVLRFQRHVGQGWDCYQRVRDAALAWEFTSSDGLKGICNVPPPSNDENSHYKKPNQKRRSAFSKRFRNGPGYTVLPVAQQQQQQQPPKMKLPDGRYGSSSNNDEDNDDGNAKDVGLGRRRAASAAVQQIWSGPGRRLITFTSIPLLPAWLSARAKLYCFNPVHVVYDLVDQRAPPAAAAPATSCIPHHHHHATQYYSSTAYATGAGHWIRGEERVTVALRDNGSVEVQILSCSKPAASVMGRLVWPVIGKMQRTFFMQQLNYLEQVAAATAELPQQPPSETTSRRRRDPPKK